MATPSTPKPTEPTAPLGTPYCTDPNCTSCNELREMQDRVSTGSQVIPIKK